MKAPVLIFAVMAPWTPVLAAEPFSHAAYEPLLDCYVRFMNGKGVTLASSLDAVQKWDGGARKRCAKEYATLARAVGSANAEQAWQSLWDENGARD